MEDVQKNKYSFNCYHINECRDCKIDFVSPFPTDDDLMKYYSQSSASLEFMQKNYIDTGLYQKKGWHQYVKNIEWYKPEKGKILDIGCGPGWFLDCAKDRGWEPYGIDYSNFFVENVKKLGITVYQGDFKKVKFEDNSFDVITAFDVIEHLKEPCELLRYIHKKLKSDGLLVLATADSGSLCAKLYASRWRQIVPIGHLFYFSKNTMTALLKKNGFKVVKISDTRYENPFLFKQIFLFIVEFTKFFIRFLLLSLFMPLAARLVKWFLKGNPAWFEVVKYKVGDQAVFGDVMKIYAYKIKS